MSHPGTHGLAEARKRDSERRRARVLAVLAEVTAANTEVSVATVARKAGVSRSFVHRHRDLHREVRAAAEQQPRERFGRGCAAPTEASGRRGHGMRKHSRFVVVVAYRRLVQVQDAQRLAQVLLDEPDLRRRWAHVCGVARRAAELAALLRLAEPARRLLVAAAWLHDIGYAPPIATGFHPVDGGRYLRRLGVPQRLCCQVAHHSGAAVEAAVRGRMAELAEFQAPHGVVTDALWTADMQTSPAGAPISVRARLREILSRYRPGDPVHIAVSRSAPLLRAAVDRTETRIRRAAPAQAC